MAASLFPWLALAAGLPATIFELVRPGWIVPGAVGAALTVAGSFELAHSNGPVAAALLLSAVLFSTELFWNSRSVTPCVAAIVLIYAVSFSPLPLLLTVLISLCLAAAAVFLTRQARRARRNKQLDLPMPKRW